MKRSLRVAAATLVTALALGTAALAQPMPEEGNWVKIYSGDNRDSDFTGGDFRLLGTGHDGTKYSYLSFCLEFDESMNLKTNYTISSISNIAESRKNYPADKGGNRDPISNATKYLMNEYVFGDFSGWGINETGESLSKLVQETIWYFENEIKSLSNTALVKYITEKMNIPMVDTDSDPSYMDWIKVVNLKDNTTHIQSQLIATSSVPEPATLLLFGAGLAGVAGVVRRKRKSADVL